MPPYLSQNFFLSRNQSAEMNAKPAETEAKAISFAVFASVFRTAAPTLYASIAAERALYSAETSAFSSSVSPA